MSNHFYTTKKSEHDTAATGAYASEGIIGYVFTSQKPGPIPLLRAYNPSKDKHFYTASEIEYNNAINKLGYRAEGTLGFLYSSIVQGTIPFYRLYNTASGDHFYTTKLNEKNEAITRHGYRDEGIVGYVWANTSSGAQWVYRSYNPLKKNHFYTMSKTEHNNATKNHGYRDEGTACCMQTSNMSNRLPFFRCYNPGKSDHFYTTSQTERDKAINTQGYRAEGIACYVQSNSSENAVPFWRLYNKRTGDHLYTTNITERDNAINSLGYVSEGVACYIFLNNISDTTQLYRLYKAYDAYINMNVILVGSDQFSQVEENVIKAAVQKTRMICRTVGLKIQNVGWYGILKTLANGRENIDSDGEAESLTNEWTVPNNALDVFFVKTYAGLTLGISRVNGSCNKDAKGMNGSIVSIHDLNYSTGLTTAHEICHFLGLGHVNDKKNLMHPTSSNGENLSAAQGNVIKKHCFVTKY